MQGDSRARQPRPAWDAVPRPQANAPRRPTWKELEAERRRRQSSPQEVERRRRANALGAKGELAALEYLEKNGAKLLARNYRCPGGEIDLVVLHEGDLVAVEVKTRTLGGLGMPEESLTWWKLKRVAYALAMFAYESRQPPYLWRIDAIVVDVDMDANVKRLDYFKSVYEDQEL